MKLTSSLNACRAKLAEPPASGNITVPSTYVAAVQTKISPEMMKASGVSPRAKAATTPSA